MYYKSTQILIYTDDIVKAGRFTDALKWTVKELMTA
jgi:hypothetical protein